MDHHRCQHHHLSQALASQAQAPRVHHGTIAQPDAEYSGADADHHAAERSQRKTISCFGRTVSAKSSEAPHIAPPVPSPRLVHSVVAARPYEAVPITYRPLKPRRGVKWVVLAYVGMDQLTIYFDPHSTVALIAQTTRFGLP